MSKLCVGIAIGCFVSNAWMRLCLWRFENVYDGLWMAAMGMMLFGVAGLYLTLLDKQRSNPRGTT